MEAAQRHACASCLLLPNACNGADRSGFAPRGCAGKAREAFRETEALRRQQMRKDAEKQAGISSRDKRLTAHPAAKYDKAAA